MGHSSHRLKPILPTTIVLMVVLICQKTPTLRLAHAEHPCVNARHISMDQTALFSALIAYMEIVYQTQVRVYAILATLVIGVTWSVQVGQEILVLVAVPAS
mmetsp:Transcript_8206/g.11283  ORF Transcript_8206/g.11283 Transcript_8206/m.11283 type:complete len:101 (-) Transcript_8206:506-808(-)